MNLTLTIDLNEYNEVINNTRRIAQKNACSTFVQFLDLMDKGDCPLYDSIIPYYESKVIAKDILGNVRIENQTQLN